MRSLYGVHAGATIASSPGSRTTSLTVTFSASGARVMVTDQYQPRYPG